MCAGAGAIVPDVTTELLFERARKIAVKHRAVGVAARNIEPLAAIEFDLKAQWAHADALQIREIVRRWIALVELNNERHIGGDTLAHPLGGRLPVIIEKNDGNNQLQYRRWRDDDQQCAPIEALRHDVAKAKARNWVHQSAAKR